MRAAAVILLFAGVAFAQPDIHVEGALGTLDPAAVQRAVDASKNALEACFREGTGGLRYVGGSARLTARVAKNGKVRKAYVADGDLGSWAVEKCLRRVARGMRFGRPTGGEAEVDLPLSFPARSPAAVGDGAELERKLRALAGCGARPAGVEVIVYVGAGGKVTSAGFAGDVSEAWGNCAAGRARALELTDPRGRVTKLAGRVP